MNFLIYIQAILTFGILEPSQDTECLDIKSPNIGHYSADTIITPGTEWKFIESLDLLDSSNVIQNNSVLTITSKKRVRYVTERDKIKFLGENKFKIIFGGKGPEEDVFEIIEANQECMIVEIRGVSEGYYDKKLVWSKEYHIRYLLKKTRANTK